MANQADDLRLTPKTKEAWLEALRSGDYEQDTGVLKTADGAYCCLGVLGMLVGVEEERLQSCEHLSGVGRDDLLGPWWPVDAPSTMFTADDPKTHTTIQRKLAAMNDKGWSFDEIADWIEANL